MDSIWTRSFGCVKFCELFENCFFSISVVLNPIPVFIEASCTFGVVECSSVKTLLKELFSSRAFSWSSDAGLTSFLAMLGIPDLVFVLESMHLQKLLESVLNSVTTFFSY